MARIPNHQDLAHFTSGAQGVYEKIHAERIRAHNLHDSHGESMERKAWDEISEWVNVTVEEVGEVSKAINEYRHGNLTFEEFKAELIKEVTQCAAMYTVWLEALTEDDQ